MKESEKRQLMRNQGSLTQTRLIEEDKEGEGEVCSLGFGRSRTAAVRGKFNLNEYIEKALRQRKGKSKGGERSAR